MLRYSVGRLLAKYKSGKLPKAFKMVPTLTNWEEILYLTEPGSLPLRFTPRPHTRSHETEQQQEGPHDLYLGYVHDQV